MAMVIMVESKSYFPIPGPSESKGRLVTNRTTLLENGRLFLLQMYSN